MWNKIAIHIGRLQRSDGKKDRTKLTTRYSLTKEFKDTLDKLKRDSPTTYIRDTLSLHQFSDSKANSEKAFEIAEESANNKGS